MKYLNIGCGENIHPQWENIDIAPIDPLVQFFDVRKGLPYPENAFDAVYSSHLLEHLTKSDASFLIEETYRVLRPGGILRLAVPDLEAIARTYIRVLDAIASGAKSSGADHNWILLELLDQTVRDRPGGEMLRYLVDPHIENRDFVISRVGQEAEKFWQPQKEPRKEVKVSASKRLENIRVHIARKIVKILVGKAGLDAFNEGLFRSSGEIHRWMYDRFSLRNLLQSHRFQYVEIRSAYESGIPNFGFFGLDVVNGKVRKPDSLFMEGVK